MSCTAIWRTVHVSRRPHQPLRTEERHLAVHEMMPRARGRRESTLPLREAPPFGGRPLVGDPATAGGVATGAAGSQARSSRAGRRSSAALGAGGPSAAGSCVPSASLPNSPRSTGVQASSSPLSAALQLAQLRALRRLSHFEGPASLSPPERQVCGPPLLAMLIRYIRSFPRSKV